MVLVPLLTRLLLIGGGLLLPAFRAFQYLKAFNSHTTAAPGQADRTGVGTDIVAHGHRMLQHFAVMSIVVSSEWIVDWLLFWLPFYYELKLLFVAWLVLPMTQGSLMFYKATLDPLLREHEQAIDGTVANVSVTIQSRISNSFTTTAHSLRSFLTAWAASLLHLLVAQQQQGNHNQTEATVFPIVPDVAPGPVPVQPQGGYYGQALAAMVSSVTSAVSYAASRTPPSHPAPAGHQRHGVPDIHLEDSSSQVTSSTTLTPIQLSTDLSGDSSISTRTIRASAYPSILIQPTPPSASLSSPVQAVINRRRTRRSPLPSPATSAASSPPSSSVAFSKGDVSPSLTSPSEEALPEPQNLMCSPMDDEVYRQ
ncbi:hypothetical protein BCR44DRAFT_1097447 [Catenaria anguillulae PL171]|uniref:Protein YOP1 n=1 Tax=Catenaria anguillulae PL171 TaxID=765915 RepID=A0A1Y2I335_9FUNG|nr:hypothetical protein BCR44DRAFT_1097447 [Catenaria anguillulae PL171]